jgi:antitoxin VapB
MNTAKLFNNGRSQAVRLPKGCRFTGREVRIARLDDVVILYPAGKGWDLLEKGIRQFDEDFLASRDQPARQQRRDKL